MSDNDYLKKQKPQKFFERYLENDLALVSDDLINEYRRIASGKMRGVSEISDQDMFSYTRSYSTQKSREYNAFQMYYPWMHEIFSSVVDMVREACEYYEIDYNSEQWMCAAWFNINNKESQTKLEWHDHVEEGYDYPAFHGYYCVNAEPSETGYRIDNKIVRNINKNNRAILSHVGYEHAMGPWTWEGNRITIAYDIVPLRAYTQKQFLEFEQKDQLTIQELAWEQHLFPLPKIKA